MFTPFVSPRVRRLLCAGAIFALSLANLFGADAPPPLPDPLALDPRGVLARPGLEVLVFNNWYDGAFSDAKIAGVELIHHGVRTATNGDVRLEPTPGQWDEVPELVERRVLAAERAVETRLAYRDYGFEYTIRVEPAGDGARIRVLLDRPLPAALVGKAGFNLEFLPSAYFEKSYAADGRTGIFPLYPVGPSVLSADGTPARAPLAGGRRLVLAPEDPLHRVVLETRSGELALYDGRNQAQNGWFVVRSPIPAGTTGAVVDWTLTANTVANWTRPVSIGHSQVGYHPARDKVAVLECDPAAPAPAVVRVLRVGDGGTMEEVFEAPAQRWGDYLRYQYFKADFSAVREEGVYVLEAAGVRTAPFRIARDVYATAWQPTIDVFLAEQMDHMRVREAYRIWHGRSHMDDARQAAANRPHFDLYTMGPSTDSPFAAGEHIPGLTVGGWFDAGDFDLRTQTHYALVRTLVAIWERFRPMRDETTIDQRRQEVEMHRPDGEPDLLQQIEHGTLMLLVQHRVFGHAIHGIVEPDLRQYTHLGDAASKTDGKVDDLSQPDSPQDDRLAFTTETTALNYGSAAALAAASRALRGFRDELADECLATAIHVWDLEHSREPKLYHFGNTTGGDVGAEELGAAVELLLTTKDPRYGRRVTELVGSLDKAFAFAVVDALRAVPAMGPEYKETLRVRLRGQQAEFASFRSENPYQVPITRRGWAGNGFVVHQGIAAYYLHREFPEEYPAAPVLQSIEYIHGCHPDSDISFVSGVGTHSKRVAYGNNRADFSFIAGGVVPGVLILNPDFPENKEDWPFFWGENEYVVDLGGSYIFLALAAQEVAARE